MQKTLIFAIAFFYSSASMADAVKSQSELALLPAYCSGTQQVRSVSKDPKPIEDYIAIYGQPYYHLHHYCWALNAENNAWRIRDKFLRESKLSYALGDIQYVLDRSGSDFALLPEILNSQARILFTLHRAPEAVVALNRAISLKPDYSPAYERLSDYYVSVGNKAQAIATLERGIGNTENATRLVKRLEKLGKTYQGVPGDLRAAKKSDEEAPKIPPSTESNDPHDSGEGQPPAPEQPPAEGSTSAPADTPPKTNPYCRFCP